MFELWHNIQLLGWRQAAAALVVSTSITALCSIAFWLLRKAVLDRPISRLVKGSPTRLYVSFGTELFALLVAVDLAVALSLVEIWKLREDFAHAKVIYPVVAVGLIVLTSYVCYLELKYEQRSFAAWLKFAGGTQQRSTWWERFRSLPTYARWWIWAFVARWFISAVHLAFILRSSD